MESHDSCYDNYSHILNNSDIELRLNWPIDFPFIPENFKFKPIDFQRTYFNYIEHEQFSDEIKGKLFVFHMLSKKVTEIRIICKICHLDKTEYFVGIGNLHCNCYEN